MTDGRREYLIGSCKRLMFVTVREEHILAGQSRNGGWSQEQLELLGVSWPPRPGWKDRTIGRRKPGSTVAAFIELKDAHLPADGVARPSLL